MPKCVMKKKVRIFKNKLYLTHISVKSLDRILLKEIVHEVQLQGLIKIEILNDSLQHRPHKQLAN